MKPVRGRPRLEKTFPSEKKCIDPPKGCGKTKSIDEFSFCKRSKDNHQNLCKECESKRAKDWYSRNKEKKNLASRRWIEENREKHNQSCYLSCLKRGKIKIPKKLVLKLWDELLELGHSREHLIRHISLCLNVDLPIVEHIITTHRKEN